MDQMDFLSFLGNCAIKPANFIYRNVIRTVCLLLSHHEMGPRCGLKASRKPAE